MIEAGPEPVPLDPPADLASGVEETEYARLLGYPDRRLPSGPVAASAGNARSWFRRHGRPWVLTRRLAIRQIGKRDVEVEDGPLLSSPLLARRLRRAGAEALMVALVSAGHEADERAASLWAAERPDDAYFADRFATAVVEHLAVWTGDLLRRDLRRTGRGPTASYAPGYPGWDLDQMARVGRCLTGDEGESSRFEILPSGMIRPASSLLAVFGVTTDLEAADRSWHRSGCQWCALVDCDFRR